MRRGMRLARLYSRAPVGIDAPLVTVEVHLSNGLPSLAIVGLPEAAVKESKDRVRSAILNGGFEFPASRITINLAPADLPKEGGRFDLPIALGVLAASGQLPAEALKGYEFFGELSLSGALRSVRGVLPAAIQAARANRALVVPMDNADEAVLAHPDAVYAVRHLLDITAHLSGQQPLAMHDTGAIPELPEYGVDLSEVRGQYQARRALVVAAAGGHSLLMMGPPGTGKTMLASRLTTILPPMTHDEAIESAAVASVSDQGFRIKHWNQRPFRNPHHTASGVALVGGGSYPRPGEVSLAHHGVLFLDELPEFDRRVLEVLREPLESGRITISRAARQAEFPASVQLVAAMNPCPCGYLGDHSDRCRCTADQVQRYRGRISGPLMDRIDLHVNVPRVPHDVLRSQQPGESSKTVRDCVATARAHQLDRSGKANARLSGKELDALCRLDDESQNLLEHAVERLGLSARAYHRIIRVARTIADLADAAAIQPMHVSEAINYRVLDRTRL